MSGSEPAFPVTTNHPHLAGCPGMTKREYFAGQVMAAMIGDGDGMGDFLVPSFSYDSSTMTNAEVVAAHAVAFADALIAELAKEKA